MPYILVANEIKKCYNEINRILLVTMQGVIFMVHSVKDRT